MQERFPKVVPVRRGRLGCADSWVGLQSVRIYVDPPHDTGNIGLTMGKYDV